MLAQLLILLLEFATLDAWISLSALLKKKKHKSSEYRHLIGWPNMNLQWNPVNTVTNGLDYFAGKDQL